MVIITVTGLCNLDIQRTYTLIQGTQLGACEKCRISGSCPDPKTHGLNLTRCSGDPYAH